MKVTDNTFQSIFIALLFFVLINVTACENKNPIEDHARTNELINFFNEIPLHRSKTEKESQSESDGEHVSIARTYHSDASFEEIREFYLRELPRRGWQFVEEREVKDRGRIKGERALDFQKGNFVLSIQFAAERRDDLGWDYAIRIAYPAENKEKV